MFLLVLNLLAAFKSLGTLMAVGLMILPATAARYWVSTITGYLLLTFIFALLSCWAGLILSFYLSKVPTGRYCACCRLYLFHQPVLRPAVCCAADSAEITI